jgi:sarcosine/dimethylglycine N-methyltransferase
MNSAYPSAVQTARDYYNSDDADNFYFDVWGGEDIHIGLYESADEDIAAASQRTVEALAARLSNLSAASRVIDLGAGYGGAARWLAQRAGCRVTCLNLSEAQNERNRELSRAAGLAERIEVRDGSFEHIPFDDASFGIVWSQDSLLHSGSREQVLEEIDRVLEPGGEIIFTDPMQADDCPDGVLEPVLARIHLDTLGSFAFYREQAGRLAWKEVEIVDLTPQLVTHYGRVRRELIERRDTLQGRVSAAYIDRMIEGLEHWVAAGQRGYLAWGIMQFRKPTR